MNLPKSVYGIRYDKSLFGYTERSAYFSSVVFAFAQKRDAQNIRKIITTLGSYPHITLDDDDNFVIHKHRSTKLPKHVVRRPLNYQNILINEFLTDKLIMQCGINGIDTCLVREFKETEEFLGIVSYYRLSMQGSNIDIIAKNLQNKYEKQ